MVTSNGKMPVAEVIEITTLSPEEEESVNENETESKKPNWFFWGKSKSKKEEAKPQKKRGGSIWRGQDTDLNLEEEEDINNVAAQTQEEILSEVLQNLQTVSKHELKRKLLLEEINLLSGNLSQLIVKLRMIDSKTESLRDEMNSISQKIPTLKRNLSTAKAGVTKGTNNAKQRYEEALNEYNDAVEFMQQCEEDIISSSQDRTDITIRQDVILRLLEEKRHVLDCLESM